MHSRSGFSSPRAFQRWSRKCRSPSGSLKNWFFVSSYWMSNPAVEYSMRRIQICLEYFVWALFGKIFWKERSKINFIKICQADLNSPCPELSNGDLGIVVALLVCWQIVFCAFLLGVQFSCTIFRRLSRKYLSLLLFRKENGKWFQFVFVC